MNLKTNHYNIIINGAGMVGASLACVLGRAGYRVLLIENRPLSALYPKDDYGLRVSAFTPSSKHWLAHAGAWKQIANSARITPFLKMNVWDAAGNGQLTFDANNSDSIALGWIIDNAVVQAALLDQLPTLEQVTVLDNTRFVSYHHQDQCVCLTTTLGESFTADLLIGADGASSQVRTFAGIASTSWSYDQKTIVGQVQVEKPHHQSCWQRFLDTGPVALLPLAEGRASLAWHTTPQEADRLLALPVAQFSDELSAALEWRLGQVTPIAELGAYPLRLNHAKEYIKPQIALAGDAAHVIHPLAGLGVNLGFLDAATLAEELINSKKTGVFAGDAHVLQRYQRRRKTHNLIVMGSMDIFKRISTSSVVPIKIVRNLGLTWVDQLSPAKKLMMRFAMGTLGDIPTLAKEVV